MWRNLPLVSLMWDLEGISEAYALCLGMRLKSTAAYIV